MLKVKVDPEMYMKTKGRATKCPRKIRTQVPGWSEFCRKMQIDRVSYLMNERLRQEVRFLTTRLGAIVREQSGPEVFAAIEALRTVSKLIRQATTSKLLKSKERVVNQLSVAEATDRSEEHT